MLLEYAIEPFAKFMAEDYLVIPLGVAVSALSYICMDIYAKQKIYRKKCCISMNLECSLPLV